MQTKISNCYQQLDTFTYKFITVTMLQQNNSQIKTGSTSAASSSNIFSYPTLWVPSIVEAEPLINHFHLKEYSEALTSEISTGMHYIYISPVTPEHVVKSIIYQLKDTDVCEIYSSQYQLLNFLNHESIVIKEAFKQIIGNTISAKNWLESKNDEPLKVREAYKIAEVAIKLLSEDEKQVELDTLFERCGGKKEVSDWNWNKKMDSLEHKFKKELERRNTEAKGFADELDVIIEELLNEPIVKKQEKLRKKAHKLGYSDAAINRILNQEKANQDKELTILSASEFEALNLTGVKHLIADYVKYGLNLIGGDSGAGKTRNAYDIAKCVIFGEEFLGEKPNETGSVLFVNSPCEMILDEISEYFFDIGILGSDKYSIVTDFNMHKLETLKSKIKEGAFPNLKLIVADSLIGILKSTDPNLDENSDKAGLVVTQLKELSIEVNVPIILLHHTNKDKDAKGVSKFRGHGSIVGNSNNAWLITSNPNLNYKVLTNVKSRSSDNSIKKVFMDDSGKWHLAEVNSEESINKGLLTQVIEFMETNDAAKKYTLPELLNAIGCNENSLKSVLKRGVDRNQLCKGFDKSKKDNRCKLYWLAKNNITPPSPTYTVVTETYLAEPVDIYGFEERLQIGCTYDSNDSNRLHSISESNYQVIETLDAQAFEVNLEIGCTTLTHIGGEGISINSTVATSEQ
ncbi:hypothetical protein NIES4075_72750 [Tolypothrix sp. NIES-4075]|uniref:AAA family ATPase n=1 Tax=Tolypothrix sp. NIES-4075 TaxID=2005459 RepID=UPI000B5D017E|nr:AAA family ATPase [Tolypothrix sp. NIES-4075]GAX46254.1 hypothetical protein NIES4075_72750 [Tolypothrix sp. NIES-4075]